MFAKAEDLERSRKFGETIQRGSFLTRLFILYIPVWFLLTILLLIIADSGDNFLYSESVLNFFGNTLSGALMSIFYLSIYAMIIPILKERSIRKWRRKNGFSIYNSIEDDFQRMEVEKRLKREQEAKKNLGIDEESGAVDKSDIRYWHGLMKDGIIDQTEFDKKKSELI